MLVAISFRRTALAQEALEGEIRGGRAVPYPGSQEPFRFEGGSSTHRDVQAVRGSLCWMSLNVDAADRSGLDTGMAIGAQPHRRDIVQHWSCTLYCIMGSSSLLGVIIARNRSGSSSAAAP